jgi:hypothetical protein
MREALEMLRAEADAIEERPGERPPREARPPGQDLNWQGYGRLRNSGPRIDSNNHPPVTCHLD